MFPLKQNTAAQKVTVVLVDSTNFTARETGVAAPTLTISKAGGAFGALSDGTWTELAGGGYTITLDASDTDTIGSLVIRTVKAGVYDNFRECWVRENTEADVAGMVKATGYGKIGNVFYVDPTNGDTHANGNRGGASDPYDSINDCLTNAVVDSNHDKIILVPDASAGATTLTEDVVVDKEDVEIIGPGQASFVIQASSIGAPSIEIQSDGVIVRNVSVIGKGAVATDAIEINGGDLVVLDGLFISAAQEHLVNVTEGEFLTIKNCRLSAASLAAGSHYGVKINSGAAGADNNRIIDCEFYDMPNAAVYIDQDTNNTQILRCIFHACAEEAINIAHANADNTQIVECIFYDITGANDIEDSGTDTQIVDNAIGGIRSTDVQSVNGTSVSGPDDLKADLTTLEADTTTLKADTTTLKADTTTLKADTITIISDVADVQTDTAEIVSDLNDIQDATSGVNVNFVEEVALSAKVGDNFELFFQNIGADTPKRVDDVGSNIIASAGADDVTIGITDDGLVTGTPIADAQVWITSDASGSTLVDGTYTTPSSGLITFRLDAGVTYYLWAQKDSRQFNAGTAFVAVADA